MTTESSRTSGTSVDERPSEPLRLTIGEHTYEVPAARIQHLHRALEAADQACTANGRAALVAAVRKDRDWPSTDHYLAADVAGDVAHWIALITGNAAEQATDPLPVEASC